MFNVPSDDHISGSDLDRGDATQGAVVPEAGMEKATQQWSALGGTQASPFNPPPKPLPTPYKPLMVPSTAWREDIANALDQLGTPILTVVDEEVWVGIGQTGIGIAVYDTLNPGCLSLFLSPIPGRGNISGHFYLPAPL